MNHELKIESILADLGLTAPRITPAMIDELMRQVTYSTSVVSGTTTTLATAIDGSGFTLCTVASASASPENFNPALGIEIAITKARAEAREKLWELEGYRLKRALHDARHSTSTMALEQIRTVLGRTQPGSAGSHAHDARLYAGVSDEATAAQPAASLLLTAAKTLALEVEVTAAGIANGTRCSAACKCSRHRPA